MGFRVSGLQCAVNPRGSCAHIVYTEALVLSLEGLDNVCEMDIWTLRVIDPLQYSVQKNLRLTRRSIATPMDPFTEP